MCKALLAGVSFLFNSKKQSICQEAEQCSAPRVRLLSNLSTLASFPKKNHQKADTEMELFEVVLLLCSALLWNILRQILSYWKLLYQRPTVKFSCYGFYGVVFLSVSRKLYENICTRSSFRVRSRKTKAISLQMS